MNEYVPYAIASVVLHVGVFLSAARAPVEPPRFSIEVNRPGAVVELVAARVKAAPMVAAPPKVEPEPEIQTPPKVDDVSRVIKPKAAPKERKVPTKEVPALAQAPTTLEGVKGNQEQQSSGKEGALTSAKPDYLRNPPPKYPSSARRLKQEGLVELRVTVSIDGQTREVSLSKSSGFSALDDAAIVAVKKWRFKPAERSGSAVESTIVVPVRFELQGE